MENSRDKNLCCFSFPLSPPWVENNGAVERQGNIDGAEGPLMKVSVVCAVYNGGEYLRPFLDSCISQNMDDIEFVCVDDGSTDGSSEILAEYAEKDSRIKAIFNEHYGVGHTVETGVNAACGDYIMFVDDDDVIMPNAIERLYAATEGVADVVKGTALSEVDGKIIQSNAFVSREPLNWREFNCDMLALHFLQPPEMWTYLFKREILPLITGGDYMFGDTDKVFRAKVVAKDFRYIPEPVYMWRVHESVSHSDRFPFDIVKAYDNLEHWLKENNINLWTIFGLSKFYAYQWNLGRLTGETRDKFAEIMRRDFRRELIDPNVLSTENRIALELILS